MASGPQRIASKTLFVIFVYIFGALFAPLQITTANWSRISKQPAKTPAVSVPAAQSTSTPNPTPTASPTVQTTRQISASRAATGSTTFRSGNPFAGERLYVDPDSNPAKQVRAWRDSRPSDAALMNKIASQPMAIWMGDWDTDPASTARDITSAARSAGSLPLLVLYNIPIRDCGSYSAGGASTASAYKNWINGVQAGSSNVKTVFILEPDAIAGWDCLTAAQKNERVTLLQYAIDMLTSSPNHYVYLDAGNAHWQSAQEISQRLRDVGTNKLSGIALNVSNFFTTEDSRNYGQQVSNLTNGIHFVIDTSRNGQGPLGGDNWCNPSGRGLGLPPQVMSGALDALLWIKIPGESDGSCNGAPASGGWWPEYALGLVQRAAF